MNKLIEINNLSLEIIKNNERKKILKEISFQVNEGEILGIAGTSGCGKTLTALSIANLLPQNIKITGGEINFNEQITTDKTKKRPVIPVIFQESKQALNPLMKAGKQITETLELAYKPKSKKEKKQNKEKVFKMLGLLGFDDPEKVYNSYPYELSGGMCQRVMAAIALINNPKLVLADEPSSSLDEDSQKCILSLLKKINTENKMSIIIISHDLSIIKDFCHRYIVMKDGQIIEEGLPESLDLQEYNKTFIIRKEEAKTLLNIKNVSNKFILKNINMEIREGEIFGLTGKSGCGKSTLARCVLGLEDYEGSIHLNGGKIKRGQLQIVFQEPGASLNPLKKIGWLMEEPLIIHKIGNKEERTRKIDKMLLRVGLDPSYKNRRPHELSGGQKQRVCIARALILEPKLLVADEATSALDVRSEGQILKLLKKLNKAIGLTIIFISHNKKAVEYLCDRVAVMEKGRIKFS